MRRRSRGLVIVALALAVAASVWLLVPRSGREGPAAGPTPTTTAPEPTPSVRPTPSAAPTPDRPVPMSEAVLATLGWSGVQQPRSTSIMALPQSRAPGSHASLNPGPVVRVELRGGETTTTSGYAAPRAELYGRTPDGSWSGTPAARWPDHPGAVRWFDFSVFLPADLPTAPAAKWMTITQWKGLNGGGPPVSLEIRDARFRLEGNVSRDLGPVALGRWSRFTVGIRFSPDASRGWVSVYLDSRLRLPRTPAATLDIVDGKVDPSYLKQGIYRSRAWTRTQVLFIGPLKVSTRGPDGA